MSRHLKSTRADQFNAKVHGLKEIFNRLDRRTYPLPTGNDVANYLKWFQQTLQSLVKETRPELTKDRCTFNRQMYPSMDYTGLYKALGKIVNVVPVVEIGVEAFAESVLSIMASLVPFLKKEDLNSMPMGLVMMLSIWPHQMHNHIIKLLASYILPILLGVLRPEKDGISYASLSCPAIIMSVLQYCPDCKQHAQFVETLMRYKSDVCLDILGVLAYGPQPVINSAGQILLHYYPLKDVGGADDWQFVYEPWHPQSCQNLECAVPRKNTPTSICLEASYAAAKCASAPPVFICEKCAEMAAPDIPEETLLIKIIQPMGKMRTTCETKECKGQGKPCSAMCFSYECVRDNRLRPLTMCQECHVRYHTTKEGCKHVTQNLFPDPWTLEGPDQAYPTEAVIRLLGEAQPCRNTRNEAMGIAQSKLEDEGCEDDVDNDINNRRMLSRFGVWLLVGVCNEPARCKSAERLGRLVSMTLSWIETASTLRRDYVGELLKRLTSQYVCRWLTQVRDSKLDVLCSCLSPNPPAYVKVGGYWESVSSKVRQHMEGLHRLCCLVPHNLITPEVWDVIMPLWIEAIKADVPPDELGRFKVLLTKIFDPLLSPLQLTPEMTFNFIKKSLESAVPRHQVEALTWLQILSQLDIIIPLHMLLGMFIKAVQNVIEFAEGVATMFPFPTFSVQSPSTTTHEGTIITTPVSALPSADLGELNSNLSCFILELDLLVKQVNIQFIRDKHSPNSAEREDIKKILKCMLDVSWAGKHGDHSTVCEMCSMTSIWFKLAQILLEDVFPEGEIFTRMDTQGSVGSGGLFRSSSSGKVVSSRSLSSSKSQVETIDEEVFKETQQESPSDVTDIFPVDLEPEPENATSDADIPSELNENIISFAAMRSMSGCVGSWRTATGSVSWSVVGDNFPQLQLLVGFLKELPRQEDHNVQLSILRCLKVLVLRGDYLRIAMDADTDFLACLQEIFFIPNIWGLLQAEHSEMSELCVQILVHCICLPYGAEKLCDEVENAFSDDDWRERFSAVEKVAVIARFLEKEHIKANNIVMSALAHCFTYLVGAVEDVCTPVHLRALFLLDTVRASSLKVLYKCIEHQYDAVPQDRLLLIHTCRLLHRIIPHHTPLSGKFFIRRFKHLLIENADFVSLGAPKGRTGSGGTGAETPQDAGAETSKRIAPVLSSKRSYTRSLTARTSLGQQRKTSSLFRCGYSFRFPGERVTYNRQVSSNADVKKSSSSNRQRRSGGFKNQSSSVDIADSMFLGGRIQSNLPTVQEEENESSRQSVASTDSSFSQLLGGAPVGSSLEAEATHQLVTLVMDFLSYPGAEKGDENSSFVKTESYEVIQMSHYLGVLMGYDIKVEEFTGNPRRLRLFPVFHAYMAGIVQVLDQNQEWGSKLLNLTLQLLLFCAAPKPQKRTQTPQFSLVRIPADMRQSWLMALLIILYKYPFHTEAHKLDTKNLIHVVLNTLDAQNHVCEGPREGVPKRSSVASIFGDSLNVGPGEWSGRSETPGSPVIRHSNADKRLSVSGINKSRDENEEKRLSERQTSSPSAFSLGSKTKESLEEEKEKDEKQPDTNDDLRPLSETQLADVGDTNSSERLLSSSLPSQDLPTFAKSVTPENSREEDKILERQSGTESKGRTARLLSWRPRRTVHSKHTFFNFSLRFRRPPRLTVSQDSTVSREQGMSRSGSLESSTSFSEQRRGSKSRMLHSLSARSFDRTLESNIEKEPSNGDLDLDHCPDCRASLEQFDEETLNLCIVVLSTFANQNPSMAMPFLLRMLQCVARTCVHPLFSWQEKSDVLMPGSTREVSKQFFRCVLIKLAPNGIFSELFRSTLKDETLLKAVAIAFNDFSSFDQMSPIAYLLEDILGSRTLNDRVLVLLSNLNTYLQFTSREPTSAWESQLSHFEAFFRKLPSVLPENCDLSPAIRIMTAILNAANSSFKILLPSFGQLIGYAINKCSFQLQDLLELCIKCTETFPKERNKLFLTRVVVLELVHAVKFRSSLPDSNLQSVLQFVAVDAGSRISFGSESDNAAYDLPFGSRTRALDCIRQYIIEAVEFLKDWRFTAKSNKENRQLSEPNLHQTTLPIDLKASVSQLVALELTKHSEDSKILSKALSWLKSPPTASQLGRQELLDCVTHIRLLAWLLHGSLSHYVHSRNPHVSCHPVKFEENTHIADYALIILFSFAEQLKEPLSKSALFHAFNVCELWTLYCDHTTSPGEPSTQATSIVMEFWGKVTPGILHLLTQAKELTMSVSHHFLNLIEALQECNSTPLPKLYPMWYPILCYCFSQGLSEAAHARLRKAQSRRRINKDTKSALAKWLKQLQFKMALTEQSPDGSLFI
ncbi:protein unc-79 homolog isoform X2 [Acropora muricata]|uniref:protein unc-79 homolog isoform X2 n=1 Tax=Acropora muricata TaxID=159855 RepID=UPI0034E60934